MASAVKPDGVRRQMVLIASSYPDLLAQRALIHLLQQQGHEVRTAFVTDVRLPLRFHRGHAGAATWDGLTAPWRLAAYRNADRWRGLAMTAASAVGTPRRRALWAARFDPWFRDSVREADEVVVLGPEAAALARVAGEFGVATGIHQGGQALRTLVEQVAEEQLRDALAAMLVTGPRPRVAEEDLAPVRRGLDRVTGLSTDGLAQDLVLQLLALPGRTRDPEQVRELATMVRRALRQEHPVVTAWLTRSDLDERAVTAADPSRVAADLLAAVEPHLRSDRDLAVSWISLALEVLFHRELHSDSVDSPLVRDPAAYLALVRDTAVWKLLTAGVDSAVPTTSAAGRVDRSGPADAAPPAGLRVLLMPGSYGTFLGPVAKSLRIPRTVDLRVVPRAALPPHLRTMTVSATVVRSRLAAALDDGPDGYPDLASMLREPAPDVVLLDWADKSAMLSTLFLHPSARIVLRVHGVDALRPWIHLLDWSRVDAVICVSDALRQLVQDVVGSRADEVPVHVVPNLVHLEQFSAVADAPRDGSVLCMVGWAQRVKDPSWALEVLAGLLADGEDWRLVLLGADFAEDATASGRAYAAAFRERAMADDVRDRIVYPGFVDDLPPVLAGASFVLSTSLRETWGVGLAQAVAAGAVPVVRDWPMLSSRGAARELYGDQFVVTTVQEAVELVRSLAGPQRQQAAVAARERLTRLAAPEGVTSSLRQVILGDLGRLADLSGAGRHDEAMDLVRAVVDDPDATPVLLHQAVISTAMAGEPTLRLEALRRWRELDPSDHVQHLLREQEGRLRELTPGWLPPVVGVKDGQQLDGRPVPDPRPPAEAPDRSGRVLHLLKASLPQRRSGYTMRSSYLLGEQRRAGMDVVAVTQLDFPPPEDLETGHEVEARAHREVVGGVPYLRLRRPEVPAREHPDDYHAAFAAALLPVVVRERPDVLHAHSGHRGYDLAMTALAVGRHTGVPVVYEVRGFFEALWTPDLAWAERAEIYRLRRAAETWCMREASAVTTLSESMRQDIIERPGIDPERVFVVPNGVDPDRMTPRERRADLVERLHLQDAFVFGYVSNLDHPREGQELLVEAVRLLRGRGLPAKALVVGDGTRAGELRELARRREVADHVIFTGQVPHDEVGDYYALLDVFVVPRIQERAARLVTPLKPYEAMAMRLPLVVSDLPALLEIVGGGTRGLTFPAGDAPALADVLARLAGDPERRDRLAEAGRQWVLDRRTWRAAAERYREVYAVASSVAMRSRTATKS